MSSLTTHIGVAATLGLANFSFAQQKSSLTTSELDQVSSARHFAKQDASINNIPVWLGGRIGSIDGNPILYGLKIRGDFAKSLYSKGVYLVFIFRTEGTEEQYSGKGAVFYRSKSGEEGDLPFQIDSFTCGYSFNPRSGEREASNLSIDAGSLQSSLFSSVQNAATSLIQSKSIQGNTYSSYATFQEFARTRAGTAYGSEYGVKAWEEIHGDLNRYEMLLKENVPDWLNKQKNDLKLEYERVSYLKGKSLSDCAENVFRHLNPDDRNVNFNSPNEKFNDFIKLIDTSLREDLKRIRAIGNSLDSRLKVISEQKEAVPELLSKAKSVRAAEEPDLNENSSLDPSLIQPFHSEEFDKKLNAAIQRLKDAAHDPPVSFLKEKERFSKSMESLKTEFEQLYASHRTKELARIEKFEQDQKLKKKAEDDKKAAEDLKTKLIIAGGVVVAGILFILKSLFEINSNTSLPSSGSTFPDTPVSFPTSEGRGNINGGESS